MTGNRDAIDANDRASVMTIRKHPANNGKEFLSEKVNQRTSTREENASDIPDFGRINSQCGAPLKRK